MTSTYGAYLEESDKLNRATGTPKRNPTYVLEYNQKIVLVDKADMQLSVTESIRKTSEWYYLFFHLLGLSL